MIVLRYPLPVICKYMHKWLEKAIKETKNEAERAMFEDILTIFDIGANNCKEVKN